MKNEYREAAMYRIKSTKELLPIKSLEKIKLTKADVFWKWIATAPIEEILKYAHHLTAETFRRVAYHEAGHAIIAKLMFFIITHVTIIPNFSDKTAGWVDTYDLLENSPEIHFAIWRRGCMALAGSLAQEKMSFLVGSECGNDFHKLFTLMAVSQPESQQREMLSYSILGAAYLVNNHFVWEGIMSLAADLLHEGTIEISTLDNIARKITNKVRQSSILSLIERMYQPVRKYPEFALHHELADQYLRGDYSYDIRPMDIVNANNVFGIQMAEWVSFPNQFKTKILPLVLLQFCEDNQRPREVMDYLTSKSIPIFNFDQYVASAMSLYNLTIP